MYVTGANGTQMGEPLHIVVLGLKAWIAVEGLNYAPCHYKQKSPTASWEMRNTKLRTQFQAEEKRLQAMLC